MKIMVSLIQYLINLLMMKKKKLLSLFINLIADVVDSKKLKRALSLRISTISKQSTRKY